MTWTGLRQWVAVALALAVLPAAGWAAPASQPSPPRPLETILPASTLAAFSWEGTCRRGDDLRRTGLVRVLRRQRVKDFFRRFYHSMRAQVERAIRGDERVVRLHRTVDNLLRSVVQAQITVGVLDLGKGGPSLVVIIRPWKEPEVLHRHMDHLLGVLASEERPLRHHSRQGHRVWSFDPDQALFPVAWVRSPTMLVVGVGPGALDRTLAVMDGRAPSRFGSALFRRAWGKTHGERSLWRVFLNTRRLGAGAGGEWSRWYQPWMHLFDLDAVQAVCVTLGTHGDGFHSVAFLDVPRPRRGLLAEFDQPTLDEKELAIVPPDADFFYATRWDLTGVYRRLTGLALTGQAEPRARPGHGLADLPFRLLELKLGFDLERDLLPHLGDTVIVYNSPSEGLYVTGLTLALTVRSRTGVQRCIERLARPRSGEPARVRIVAGNEHGDRFWMWQFQDDTEVAPTIGLGQRHVLVGLFPQPVLAGLRRSRHLPPSWPGPQAYHQIRRRLPERVVTLRYADVRPSVRLLLGLAPVLIRSSWPRLRALGLDLDITGVPTAGEVEAQLPPCVGVTTVDEEGIVSQAYVSIPLPAGLAEILPTLITGRILLNLARQLHRARPVTKSRQDR